MGSHAIQSRARHERVQVGKTVIDFPPKMLFGIQLKETQNALHLIYVDVRSRVHSARTIFCLCSTHTIRT